MQAVARSFTFKYGKEEQDKIEWRILSESEQITVCPMEGRTNVSEVNAKPIVRITGPDGSIHYPKEPGKRPRVRQQSCYVCRQYSDKFFNTQWKCRDCGMPLCQVSRVDTNACRQYSCIVEHKMSGNKFIGCGKIHHRTHFTYQMR